MSAENSIDRSLLKHTGWTRALAARLVTDPDRADELSQDTLLMAIERPPRRGGDLRAWLGTVMGNLLRQGRRRETRVREREQRRARPEAQPSVLETLERAATHRELVDVLMQVEEPLRTALVLRFFEGLPPREVARRLSVPVNTVRSRVRRGLARMRSSLDRRKGDRRAWLSALSPMLAEAAPSGGILTGVSIMSLKMKLIVAAAAIVAGVLWTQWPSPSRAEESVPSTAPSPAGIVVAGESSPGGAPAGRATALERTAVTRPPAETASDLVEVHGRVVGVDASPLPGIGVAFQAAVGVRTVGAVSDSDGGFEISIPPQSGTILVDEPGYVTVFSGSYRPDGQITPVVVAARSRTLNAVVLDQEGRPLAGARTQVHIPWHFATRFTQVLESSQERPVYDISDEAGRVSMPQLPVIDGAELLTSLRGYRTDRQMLVNAGDGNLRIVLDKELATGAVLQGVVLDRNGAAAGGAHVALDNLTARAEDDGTFRFDLAESPEATRLRALYPGSLPAELSRLPHQEWPDFVTLRLETPSEVIAGRVVDPAGAPQEGVVVWISDPTLFGSVDTLPAQVENLLAGSRSLQELDSYAQSQPQGFDRRAFMDSTPTAFWTWTQTDALGRFRLEGLLPRAYKLSVLRRPTLEMMETAAVQAGRRDVRIEFGDREIHHNVAGRVIDRDGRPLSGVNVTYSRSVFSVRNPDDPPGRYAAAHDMAIDPVQTDEQGMFRLSSVPRGLELLFYGDAIIATRRELPPGVDPVYLEAVVPSRVHVRVELSVPGRADAFAILDASGRAMGLQLIRVGRRQTMMRGALSDGRSQILATEDGPFTLALYLGDQEVERHPVHLRPGDTNVLRY